MIDIKSKQSYLYTKYFAIPEITQPILAKLKDKIKIEKVTNEQN